MIARRSTRHCASSRSSPGPLMVMPYEKIEFDETGQNPHARELMLQVQGGKVVTVWPDNYASAKPVIPFR